MTVTDATAWSSAGASASSGSARCRRGRRGARSSWSPRCWSAPSSIAVLAIGIGKYTVAPADVLGVLVGTNTSFDRVVVLEWRMPRMLMALLIGAALGVSGAIFQALTRNALGSPDIIGINSGAYTGALVVIAGIGGGYYAVAAGALVGGLVTAVVVYALSYRNGLAGYRLIVVGIACQRGAELGEPVDRHQARLPHRRHRVGVAAGHAQRPELDAGAADDGLPGRRWPWRWWRSGRSCRCCRWATTPRARSACGPTAPGWPISSSASAWWRVACAAAGPISFVALAAPQIARRLTASPGVGLVPSAAMGAVLLLVSDVIAQQVFARQRAAGGRGHRVARRRVPDLPARRTGAATMTDRRR